MLYGYNNETTEFGLRKLTTDAGGVTVAGVQANLIQGFGVDIMYAGGRIYANNGKVVDPKLGAVVGTLPVSGPVAVDVAKKRVYCLENGKALHAIDSETLTKRAEYQLKNVGNSAGCLIAMGENGVAFCTETQVVIVPLSLLAEKQN